MYDPCPLNPAFNGLLVDWFGDVFVNPPYSDCEAWIDKALTERAKGRCGVIQLLLPAWTDRAWFKKIADKYIFFSSGRVSFLDPVSGIPVSGNPHGSMIVYV